MGDFAVRVKVINNRDQIVGMEKHFKSRSAWLRWFAKNEDKILEVLATSDETGA